MFGIDIEKITMKLMKLIQIDHIIYANQYFQKNKKDIHAFNNRYG